jgi:hypothetical protein
LTNELSFDTIQLIINIPGCIKRYTLNFTGVQRRRRTCANHRETIQQAWFINEIDMATSEQKKKLLKAKIAIALQDELGRVPKEEEIDQVFFLTLPSSVLHGGG